MRIRLIKYLSVAILASPLAVNAQISVEEAIKITLAKNLQIKESQYKYALSEQDLYQAKSNLYPNLNIGVSDRVNQGLAFDQVAGQLVTGNKWTNSAGINISSEVTLFAGFQKINEIRANKIKLLGDASALERVKNDLILAVLTNYLEAITNQELTKASKQQVALSEEQLRVETIQFELGTKTLSDIAQVRNQVATDKLNLYANINAYELSLLSLKQLMEMDAQQPLILIAPEIGDYQPEIGMTDIAAILLRARNFQPELKQAALNRDYAAQQIKIARGAAYPQLALQTSYGTNYSSIGVDPIQRTPSPFGDQLKNNKSFSAGLTLRIPIFNNNNVRIAVNKAKLNLQIAENSLNLAERNLNKTVNQALLDKKGAQDRFDAAKTAFETAKIAFEVLEQRYDIGVANAMERFTAQTQMNKAQFELIQLKYLVFFKDKIIDYYMGNPISFNK